ncbi:small acid-soluble spore protein H (minor) [Natronincola peptidivorans]|uniref:Small acid-soluble spore protein H (Minor) n=1 Tax=Natronincola peptidivorans TaxID=426128 RepID=A0A1I0FZ13_9FIRM|nr:H-type small acid-soluble spore protein [Natronincola peptidivorans]SET63560.1 small acid-soluble spore protein H (minor) [Natronincola peptidivorans]
MNFNRAQEIVNSPNHIEVLHQGKPVWITGLDSQRNVAEVQEEAQAVGNKKEVPLKELIENGVEK